MLPQRHFALAGASCELILHDSMPLLPGFASSRAVYAVTLTALMGHWRQPCQSCCVITQRATCTEPTAFAGFVGCADANTSLCAVICRAETSAQLQRLHGGGGGLPPAASARRH